MDDRSAKVRVILTKAQIEFLLEFAEQRGEQFANAARGVGYGKYNMSLVSSMEALKRALRQANFKGEEFAPERNPEPRKAPRPKTKRPVGPTKRPRA